MKTRLIFITLFLLTCLNVMACPVCEKQQPKVLRGITHGAGPQSDWDYVIIGVVALIVIVTLVYTIRFLVRPGENQKQHIKNIILDSWQ